MKLSDFMRGLAILQPHYEGGDGYHLGAEHDEFFAYKTATPLSEDEVAEMKKLGWRQVEMEDDEPYDPEQGWAVYL